MSEPLNRMFEDEMAIHQLEAEILSLIQGPADETAEQVALIVQRKLKHLVAAANNVFDYISREDNQLALMVRFSIDSI